MIRWCLTWAVGLALTFAASIGLIRAQPYDDHDLRAILMTGHDCDHPCFIGIQTGKTSVNEALAILSGHRWIGKIRVFHNAESGAVDLVNWRWSGHQPSMIGRGENSQYGTLSAKQGVVNHIGIATTISLGDIWLHWGIPEEYWMRANYFVRISPAHLAFINIYKQYQFRVSSSATCPYYPNIWEAPVSIYLGDDNAIAFQANVFFSESQPFPDRVIEVMQNICRE